MAPTTSGARRPRCPRSPWAGSSLWSTSTSGSGAGRTRRIPTIVDAKAERDAALAEIKEAADSEQGLFDLPTNDVVGDSAIGHAGPLAYTEASPYVSADRQEREGRLEDRAQCGTPYDGDSR